MHKLLTGLVAASALTLLASAGMACDFHDMNVNASVPAKQVVAMSTTTAPTTTTTTSTDCAAGQAGCPTASK